MCPKITSKGSHTNLPRSRSRNGPTNPKNKFETNPKQKHNTRSKGLRQSAVAWADCLQGGSRLSVGPGWTVYKLKADHPKIALEPPVAHHKKRTIRTVLVERPPNLLEPKPKDSMHLTKTRTNKWRTRRTLSFVDRSRLPGGLSASCEQSSPSPSYSRSNPPSLCLISRINQGIAAKP
jgi:hypothetical protein